MNKLKESVLNDSKKGRDTINTSNQTTNHTTNVSNETTSTTNTATTPATTTISIDTYVYGIGILAVLAIGVCVVFAYNTFRPKNKKLINEEKDQPPKGRHML